MNILVSGLLFFFFQLQFKMVYLDDGFRVFGGDDIDQKEIPWIVNLFGCGGSLITER